MAQTNANIIVEPESIVDINDAVGFGIGDSFEIEFLGGGMARMYNGAEPAVIDDSTGYVPLSGYHKTHRVRQATSTDSTIYLYSLLGCVVNVRSTIPPPMTVSEFTLLVGYDAQPTEDTTETITFVGNWDINTSLALYVNEQVIIDFAGKAVDIVSGVETEITFTVTSAEWEDIFAETTRPIELVIADQTDPTNILYKNEMHPDSVDGQITYNGDVMTYNGLTMTYSEI